MDWAAARQWFPVTRKWAFLDHAAVAPISGPAQQALHEYAADLAENGDVNERRWLERIEDVRSMFAKLLSADPLDIAFTKNTSEGIGIVAEGFPWQAGDNVIIAEEEYPANQYPWLNLQSRGVEVRRVPSSGSRLPVESIEARMDAKTRILSLSFVEYASGFRNDLDALGNLCRTRGIHFFVDAIQGLGVLPLDLHKTPVDFLAADGHKWLLGPEGAGIFFIRRELVDLLRPIGIGWNSVVAARDFSRIDLTLKPHAGRWESGSLNVAGISALGASLKMLLDIGIDKIAGRVLELTGHLCAEAGKLPGVSIFSSRSESERSGIVALALEDTGRVGELVHKAKIQGIVVNKRAGRLRISPHFYNTFDDIDRLLAILR